MKRLTYVEIDVDFCSLTWGAAPCQARFGYSGASAQPGAPGAVTFDGTGDYLVRGATLTGAADSKQVTGSFWFRRNGALATAQTILANETTVAGTTYRFVVYLETDNTLRIVGKNAAGTTILDVRTSAFASIDNAWHNAQFSFDLTGTSKRWLYIDDVAQLTTVTTYTNDTLDFTVADWSIGGAADGTALLDADLADLWFQPGLYLDLSSSTNRRKFIAANFQPIDMGAAGAGPTGSSPLVFLAGATSTWHQNLGTGAGFTKHGTLTDAVFAADVVKCFNTRSTCHVPYDFANAPVTLRYAVPTDFLPALIEAIPSITNISFTPAVISLGKDLGQRATCQIDFKDHRHSDTGPGYDKYLTERPYDPFKTGTYWGKFRTRQTFLFGRPLRVIRGKVGDALADMEVRNYIIDSFTGPDINGRYTIFAKDILKLADGDTAQAPVLSNGFLNADITNSATTATLSPSGIGAEYPASGYAAIGGTEIVSFTRASDVLTITRGQLNTTGVAHNAQDRVQICLRYVAQDPADIISDLFQTYAAVPSANVPLTTWEGETGAFLRQVYTATIAEPTSVNTLISELVEQAGLAIWWDDLGEQIRLQVLRQIQTDAFTLGDQNWLENSLQIQEQPDKRVSQVWTYYGQISPLSAVDDTSNYRSVELTIDGQAEIDYGSPAIKKIFSRWIPQFGRVVASRVNDIQLGRFRDPPRLFSFSTFRTGPENPALGAGFELQAWPLQLRTGNADTVPIQITRLNPGDATYDLEAEEMRFITRDQADYSHRTITIDANTNNFNLKTVHDTLFPAAVSGDAIVCVISPGVVVSSTDASIPAFSVGTWPAGVTITFTNRGAIIGAGGKGGNGVGPNNGSPAPTAGQQGGTALYTRQAITMDNGAGSLKGGGAGGGGSNTNTYGAGDDGGGGGGGGAGNLPGPAGSGLNGGENGTPGAGTTGGHGGRANTTENWWDFNYLDPNQHGGDGGALGSAGTSGTGWGGSSGAAGGAAGDSIDGVSYITFTSGSTNTVGPKVN